jgi:hypothetical protein
VCRHGQEGGGGRDPRRGARRRRRLLRDAAQGAEADEADQGKTHDSSAPTPTTTPTHAEQCQTPRTCAPCWRRARRPWPGPARRPRNSSSGGSSGGGSSSSSGGSSSGGLRCALQVAVAADGRGEELREGKGHRQRQGHDAAVLHRAPLLPDESGIQRRSRLRGAGPGTAGAGTCVGEARKGGSQGGGAEEGEGRGGGQRRQVCPPVTQAPPSVAAALAPCGNRNKRGGACARLQQPGGARGCGRAAGSAAAPPTAHPSGRATLPAWRCSPPGCLGSGWPAWLSAARPQGLAQRRRARALPAADGAASWRQPRHAAAAACWWPALVQASPAAALPGWRPCRPAAACTSAW